MQKKSNSPKVATATPAPANTASNLECNQHTRQELTPAQIKLLDFISHREASSIYESISTTLSLSISDFSDRDDPESHPTPLVLEAWFFTLELLRHIHSIAAEKPGA